MRRFLIFNSTIFLLIYLICISSAQAQNSPRKKLNIEELFSLTVQNNANLQVAKANIGIAEQQTAVTKLQQLPTLEAAANAMYLGNGTLIDRDFSQTVSVPLPHFGNNFSLQAKQLLWKGGLIKNTILASSLQEDLSELNYQNNEQSVKLLVLGYYLDLYKLQNQHAVYLQNVDLAQKRLILIQKNYEQGVITKNDVIRGELQLSNLNLAVQVIENNISILNKQLSIATGLAEDTHIIADDRLLDTQIKLVDINSLRSEALATHPSIQAAEKLTEINQVRHKITQTERRPALLAFAGNNLNRPITSSTPALDMYMNSWNAGASLSFDIASLYTTPRKLKLNKLQIAQSQANETQVLQQIDVAVTAAYTKYKEAISQWKTLETNKNLANENYRIIERKYLNQLALVVDMLDASNAKLDAELQYTNAEINILYAYYKLIRETGKL